MEAKEVKSKLNIIDVVRFYGIAVSSKGKAICPFHNDHHASLSFKNEMYTCFSCGEHGDVIDFTVKYFNLSFQDALIKLNQDFQLGLSNSKLTISELEQIERHNHALEVIKQRQQDENRQIGRLEKKYRIVFDAYCRGNKKLKPYIEDLDNEIDWRLEQNE